MLTTGVVLVMVSLAASQAGSPSRAEIAELELRKAGFAFRPLGLYNSFLVYPKTYENYMKLKEMTKGDSHLVIYDCAKLRREHLKYLHDLPRLKEIVVGPEFPEDWFQDLESLTQLKGLFIGGDFSTNRGISDRALASVAKLTNLQALSLLDAKVTDKGLRHLEGLTQLRWLSLSGVRNITDVGLVHLKHLKNLEDLNLEVTKTTAAGLVHLQGLTKLRRLGLPNELQARHGAPGLEYLAHMTDMRRLDARGLCAGDDDLKALRHMTKLEDLNLCYTQVTDKGLKHLAGLTALKELDLFGTGVTGDGLKHLRHLKNLKSLVLGFCPLEDRAAEHLRHMTQLEYLEVGDTNMTKQAIAELKRLLPKTTVR